jgi:hypothetical protein
MRMRSPVLLLVIGATCLACSPQPSADTAAMEPYLLTVGEVGAGFSEQRGGQVSTDIGHLCPETDVSVGGFGAVKAWFTTPSGDEVVELLYAAEPAVVDELMEDIKTAFNECDGIAWDYFGEARMIEVVDGPLVSDDQIAVHRADTDCADCYTVYARIGNVITIISVPDHSETYDDIVAKAIDKLPE